MNTPHSCVVGNNSEIYVTDAYRVSRINPPNSLDGLPSVGLAGLSQTEGYIDGYGFQAYFENPTILVLDSIISTKLYVYDQLKSSLRQLNHIDLGSSFNVTTLLIYNLPQLNNIIMNTNGFYIYATSLSNFIYRIDLKLLTYQEYTGFTCKYHSSFVFFHHFV